MVAAGALAAGFVSGLAGFGTGLVALGFWLHAIDPVLAAPLVAICSVVGQVQSLVSLRQSVRRARLWPFLVGGLLGVPVGVLLLDRLDITTFRAAVGVFLIIFCSAMLLARRIPTVAWGGRAADGARGDQRDLRADR